MSKKQKNQPLPQAPVAATPKTTVTSKTTLAVKQLTQQNVGTQNMLPTITNISSENVTENASENTATFWSKITNGYVPYIIICLMGLGLYVNTFKHEYALDDDIIVCKNTYVLQGVKRLDTILSSDVFTSFYKQMNTVDQLSGGRYRPLAQVTYAIEQELIGTIPRGVQNPDGTFIPETWDLNKNKIKDAAEDINNDGLWNDNDVKVKGMHMRHVVNVLLYILSVCIMFLFLSSYFFKQNKMLALLTCLLFLAHPIHTEVVANVKSRDEILSLLFMLSTLVFSFKAIESKNWKHVIVACICYFAALLSKEYGVTLLAIVPLAIYLYFKNLPGGQVVRLLAGLFVTFGIYYAIRSSIVLDLGNADLQNTELLNNPFKLATDDQKLATQIFINLKYFILLVVPYKLSCDYSYGTIPYQEMTNLGVILSLLVLIGFGICFIMSVRKRSWLAFPIAFILMHLFLINNAFFNIGATMGERLVYHSSFGMCMLLAFGVYYLFNTVLKNKNMAYAALLLPIILLYSFKTIARNPAWKNDISLHLTDVKTYPNSTMLCGNACTRLIELSEQPKNEKIKNVLLDSANTYGHKALQMHPDFVNTFINMGIIKSRKGMMDSAAYFWGKVEKLYPHHPQLPMFKANLAGSAYTKGLELIQAKKLPEGLAQLLIAYKSNPTDPRLMYDIGVTYYNLQNFPAAKEIWNKALVILPNDTNLQRACQQMAIMKY